MAHANGIKVQIGDVLEIDGRLYDVVPDKQGGATLEPAITMTVDELLAKHGLRPLTPEESRSCSATCRATARDSSRRGERWIAG